MAQPKFISECLFINISFKLLNNLLNGRVFFNVGVLYLVVVSISFIEVDYYYAS